MIEIGYAPIAAGGLLVALVGYALYIPSTATAFASRISRMLPCTFAYWGMVAFGTFVAVVRHPSPSGLIQAVALTFVAIAASNWGEWLLNDLFDKETDEYANESRETTRGDVTDRETAVVGSGLVALGLGVAALLGPYAFGAVLLFNVVFAAYSIPPFRFKSNPYTCMLSIGLMGGACFLLGTAVVATGPSSFSMLVTTLIVVTMTVNVSYKDLKDAEHDAKSGTANFVVKFGRETMRRMMMVSIPVTYAMALVIFGVPQLAPVAVIASLLVAYLLHDRESNFHQLVYELDIINGVFLLVLGTTYYLEYAG